MDKQIIGVASPSLLVYKTSGEYNSNVPVILSEDKSEITSYPDIKDVYYQGALAYPTMVADGYLIDNRGIGKNVAFISHTYEAYSQLKETPSAEELYSMIIDKDPLLELYDLGPRIKYKDLIEDVNNIILNGELKNYKRLK